MSDPTDNLTPKKARWRPRFLACLAETSNVSAACAAARVSRQVAYQLRADDPEFAALWEDAIESACDGLELEARRRAYHGVEEPVIYKGEVMGDWVDARGRVVPEGTPGAAFRPLTVRRPSDTLLIFLLKAHRPEKYRESLKLLGGGKDGEIVVKTLGGGAKASDV